MSYTAGPWAVSKNETLVFGKKQGSGLEPIGFIYGPAFAEDSDYGRRCIANVHLCAAAPAMLEACEWCVALCEEIGATETNAYASAKAAIRAAKGEA